MPIVRFDWTLANGKNKKMRTTTLDKKIEILNRIFLTQSDWDFFSGVCETYDVSFWCAFLIGSGYTETPTDEGVRHIEEGWLIVLAILRVEDIGYDNLDQLLEGSTRFQDWLDTGEVDITEDEIHGRS